MKRCGFILGVIGAAVILLSSCNLLGLHDDAIYFYSMGMEWDEPIDYELQYSASGYTIIMSCGIGGEKLSKDEAEDLKAETEFTLKLFEEEGGAEINNSISAPSNKTVKNLGWFLDKDYHVVQEFTLHSSVERGTYRLVGTTKSTYRNELERVNEVQLTIR